MRMRRKRNLDTRMEQCSHLLIEHPQELCGRWLEEFPYNKLHVEFGCGKGRFTVETAKTTPDVLLVAIERVANVIVAAMERTEQNGLDNIRYICGLVDDIDEFFSKNEVSRIYLNFSDPWPANRHIRRRLTHLRFLEMYKKMLTSNGEIHLKTDNLPLFEYSLNQFERYGFSLKDVSYNLHEHGPVGIMTDYEKRFYEQGLPIFRCVAKAIR